MWDTIPKAMTMAESLTHTNGSLFLILCFGLILSLLYVGRAMLGGLLRRDAETTEKSTTTSS